MSQNAIPVGGAIFVEFDDEKNAYLVLDGFIGMETAEAFTAFLKTEDVDGLFILNSQGGLIDASHIMGRAIQKHGLHTAVVNDCFSACVDVFLAGKLRLMDQGSLLGLHATPDPQASYQVDLNYYREIGFEDLLKQSYQVPFEKIWIIDAQEALQKGLATEVI